MNAKIVFDNPKDKELLSLIDLKVPFFVEYIDINTAKGKKEGWKLLNYYGTAKLPFVEIDDKLPFYSERGNAINQLITYLNDRNSF